MELDNVTYEVTDNVADELADKVSNEVADMEVDKTPCSPPFRPPCQPLRHLTHSDIKQWCVLDGVKNVTNGQTTEQGDFRSRISVTQSLNIALKNT